MTGKKRKRSSGKAVGVSSGRAEENGAGAAGAGAAGAEQNQGGLNVDEMVKWLKELSPETLDRFHLAIMKIKTEQLSD